MHHIFQYSASERKNDEDIIIMVLHFWGGVCKSTHFIVNITLSSLLIFPPQPQGEQIHSSTLTLLEQENKSLQTELAAR